MNAIRGGLGALRQALAKVQPTDARELIAELNESLSSIAELHRLLLTASVNDERRRAIDVNAEVRFFKDLIAPILDDQGVQMDVICSDPGVIRTDMRPECLICILQILVTNSLEWLKGVDSARIRVSVTGYDDSIEIVFSDNGPGVPLDVSTRIFDPLFTRKEGGRGMGLTIARHLVESHRGTITLLADGRRRGANLLIRLPRKRPRATIY
jgi:signal transduction histidine kinase